MSRTHRHTPPDFVYRHDDDGWIVDADLLEASKHYDQYKGWRYAAQQRNRRVRRDKSYTNDFEGYTLPKLRTGWWAD